MKLKFNYARGLLFSRSLKGNCKDVSDDLILKTPTSNTNLRINDSRYQKIKNNCLHIDAKAQDGIRTEHVICTSPNNPTVPEAYCNLAKEMYDKGNEKESLNNLAKAIVLAEDCPEVMNMFSTSPPKPMPDDTKIIMESVEVRSLGECCAYSRNDP